MKDVNASISSGYLEVGDYDYFHISHVEVFTGDDDYNETDCIEVCASEKKLIAKQTLTPVLRPSKDRIRFEPGVRIYLSTEVPGEAGYILTICHHKGRVNVRCEEGV